MPETPETPDAPETSDAPETPLTPAHLPPAAFPPPGAQFPPPGGEFAAPEAGFPTVAFAPPPTKKRRGWVIGLVATLSVFALLSAAGVVAFLQRDNIRDLITVSSYEPSAIIAGYIERTSLSERGEFLFKASQPRVASPTEFNSACGSSEVGMGILGCYLPQSRTILLYDVTDDRLDGIEETIAVHEMLHAAWDRMTTAEQKALEPLLEAEAEKRADDPLFIDRMEFYAVSEPGQRHNELHSIIGTETKDISKALEKHYAQFFENRQVVVGLHVASDKVLRDLETRAEKLSAELEKLYDQITADDKKLTKLGKQLEKDIASFNARAETPGGFYSQAQFNNERSVLIDRSDKLVKSYEKLEKRSASYDKKLDELEGLDAELASLNEELNIEAPADYGL